MRKYSIVVLILALGFISKEGFTWRNGAPSGRSGSLGDGSNTCASASCHSGPAATDEQLSIQVPITLDGYTLGDTLMVTVEMNKVGVERFGFQLAAENELGQKVGKFIPVSGATKLAGSNITHVSASADASDSKSWMFEWVAPVTAEGTVTFYAAGNFSNKNGNAAGDVIVTSQHSVPQSTMSIGEKNQLNIKVYPNPTSDYITIVGTSNNASVSIYSLSGALLVFERGLNQKIDLTELPVGSYLLKVEDNREIAREIISITR